MITTPTQLDPTQYYALQTLDMGNVLSPDGRAHPFDGSTPVVATAIPASFPIPSALNPFSSWHWPPNFGARVAIGIIAVLILVLVVARFLY